MGREAGAPLPREHGRHARHLAHRAEELEQAHPTRPVQVVDNPHRPLAALCARRFSPRAVSPPGARLGERDAAVEEGRELLGDALDVGGEGVGREGVALCRTAGRVAYRSCRASDLTLSRLRVSSVTLLVGWRVHSRVRRRCDRADENATGR